MPDLQVVLSGLPYPPAGCAEHFFGHLRSGNPAGVLPVLIGALPRGELRWPGRTRRCTGPPGPTRFIARRRRAGAVGRAAARRCSNSESASGGTTYRGLPHLTVEVSIARNSPRMIHARTLSSET